MSRMTKESFIDPALQRLRERAAEQRTREGSLKRATVVTGGSSGLGNEILKQGSRKQVHKGRWFNLDVDDGYGWFSNSRPIKCDITREDSIKNAALIIQRLGYVVDRVINNAGVNQIATFEDLEVESFDYVMEVNARSLLTVTRAFLPDLKETKGVVCNIISNAAHTPMTHSFAYNASKGAAHIATLQMARELTPEYGITVFGVAPAKLEGTRMSGYVDSNVAWMRGWTASEVKDYQLRGLLAGAEVPPERVAEMIVWLMQEPERTRWLTGCVLPYGATR